MRYNEFIEHVQNIANIRTRDEAEQAIRATFETLSERITGGQAGSISVQLPEEIAAYLKRQQVESPGTAESFSLDEFFRRIGEREGVDMATATQHARAVTQVLSGVITEDELDKTCSQLPDEFETLFRDGRIRTKGYRMGHTEFIERVQSLADIPTKEEAERAIRATFETLAERISAGEADDVASQLPEEIATYLRRQKAGGQGEAKSFSLNEFFDRVSNREGVDPTIAAQHAQAVAKTLSEAISQDELSDVRSQLPKEFDSLFGGLGMRIRREK